MAKLHHLFTLLVTVMTAVLADISLCQNTAYAYNPRLRTACYQCAFVIVAVDAAALQTALTNDPRTFFLKPKLLARTKWINDFPDASQFPVWKHPLLVEECYNTQVQQNIGVPAAIQQVRNAAIYAPYVDASGDGRTPFQLPIRTYYCGDNSFLSTIVPSLVTGLFEGFQLIPAICTPVSPAYDVQFQTVGPYSKEYFSVTNVTYLENGISGPAVADETINEQLAPVSCDNAQLAFFYKLVNQPTWLTSGLVTGQCQRNTIYYNYTFAQPELLKGVSVILYSSDLGQLASVTVPKQLAGVYNNPSTQYLKGFTATGVNVGFDPQPCKEAAGQNDPISWTQGQNCDKAAFT